MFAGVWLRSQTRAHASGVDGQPGTHSAHSPSSTGAHRIAVLAMATSWGSHRNAWAVSSAHVLGRVCSALSHVWCCVSAGVVSPVCTSLARACAALC